MPVKIWLRYLSPSWQYSFLIIRITNFLPPFLIYFDFFKFVEFVRYVKFVRFKEFIKYIKFIKFIKTPKINKIHEIHKELNYRILSVLTFHSVLKAPILAHFFFIDIHAFQSVGMNRMRTLTNKVYFAVSFNLLSCQFILGISSIFKNY